MNERVNELTAIATATATAPRLHATPGTAATVHTHARTRTDIHMLAVAAGAFVAVGGVGAAAAAASLATAARSAASSYCCELIGRLIHPAHRMHPHHFNTGALVPVATAWWMRNDGSGVRVTEKTMGHCKQRRCLPTASDGAATTTMTAAEAVAAVAAATRTR
jgi:hypothetical protein